MMSERGRAPNRAHERVDATGLSRAYGQEGRGAGESVCWLSESRRQIGSRLAQGRLKVGDGSKLRNRAVSTGSGSGTGASEERSGKREARHHEA